MISFKRTACATSILAAALGMVQITHADTSLDDGHRQIRNIEWFKDGHKELMPVDSDSIPLNQGNLIFIRPVDIDGLQTSANVSVGERFQVSIQPGYFSQVLYCSGNQDINVTLTGNKNNDLAQRNRQTFQIEPKRNNFFIIDVDDATNIPSITKLDAETAAPFIQGATQQAHQISRVVLDCPEVTYVPPVVQPEPVREQVELFKPFRLDVLFEFDKDVIQPVYNQRIQDLADFLVANPDTVALIEGHTDSMGTAEYNLDLSRRRAAAVKRELVNAYGMDPSRLITQGYGESQPIDTNDTKAGRQNNRRVVAIVTPK